MRSRIIGTGSYLPKKVLTNADLASVVDTSDDWIVKRTGIRQRHIAADGERTSDLGVAAAREALKAAGVDAAAGEVDLIVVATTTPDETFPATAARIQAMLGMTNGAAFDVQAVCAGFVFALSVADSFIANGAARTVLVIGAETYSNILDWTDRGTCVLFGDGAGAVVLRAEEGSGSPSDFGILSTHLRTDGRHHDLLYVDGGVSSTRTTGHLRMRGPDVFRHAVTMLAEVAQQALEANGLSAEQVDWLVPHQANLRIIDGAARKLDMPMERVVVTVDRHANTSAASVPLALDEAVRDGRIKPGHVVLMEALGGGFSWGAALARW
ncbi:MAG: ketoacyl-ACP synthase III [Rhodospirillaceae bacterium]|nr:ketoacyl-ACP synthase III [Rhodospirillaceae bacterium]